MVRGGYMKYVANGIFSSYMPLKRITRKIEQIIREEMDAVDGQEVQFPVVMPASIWQESGRYESIGKEMARFHDRSGSPLVLGMTHEEAAVHLVRDYGQSYMKYPFTPRTIRAWLSMLQSDGLSRKRSPTSFSSFIKDTSVFCFERMTHEEAAVHLVRDYGQSYMKYPFMVYQIQTKFRDEARPRAGLIRVREFTMKTSSWEASFLSLWIIHSAASIFAR